MSLKCSFCRGLSRSAGKCKAAFETVNFKSEMLQAQTSSKMRYGFCLSVQRATFSLAARSGAKGQASQKQEFFAPARRWAILEGVTMLHDRQKSHSDAPTRKRPFLTDRNTPDQRRIKRVWTPGVFKAGCFKAAVSFRKARSCGAGAKLLSCLS